MEDSRSKPRDLSRNSNRGERAGLFEQINDLDKRGTVYGLGWLLGGNEFVRARKVSGGQVESVHCSEARLGRFRLRDYFNPGHIPVPGRVPKVSLVERPLQPLLVENRLRQDL